MWIARRRRRDGSILEGVLDGGCERWEGGRDVHCGCVIIVGLAMFSGRSEVTLLCVVFDTEYLVLSSVCLFMLRCVVLELFGVVG